MNWRHSNVYLVWILLSILILWPLLGSSLSMSSLCILILQVPMESSKQYMPVFNECWVMHKHQLNVSRVTDKGNVKSPTQHKIINRYYWTNRWVIKGVYSSCEPWLYQQSQGVPNTIVEKHKVPKVQARLFDRMSPRYWSWFGIGTHWSTSVQTYQC